jgi:hypothetical protein
MGTGVSTIISSSSSSKSECVGDGDATSSTFLRNESFWCCLGEVSISSEADMGDESGADMGDESRAAEAAAMVAI